MRWTVVYLPSAQNDLAAIWMESTGRQAVADAADAIDALLRSDPLGVGESRTLIRRVIIKEPLTIFYKVSQDDRLVSVTAVHNRRR